MYVCMYGMVWYGTVWYGMVCMFVCLYFDIQLKITDYDLLFVIYYNLTVLT